VSELSDRLRNAKGDRSIDWIVDHAARTGHEIHRSVVAKYISGKHGPRPPEATLAALAAGLDLDVRELRALAGRQPGELGAWIPPAESASLTQEEWDALDQLIRAMTRGTAAGQEPAGELIAGGTGGSVTSIRPPKPLPADLRELAADQQDGPTAEEADEELNRQRKAGEEDQDKDQEN